MSLRMRSLCAAIEGLTREGRQDEAREVLVEALDLVRRAGRRSVFEVLESSAEALAGLDRGETLAKLSTHFSKLTAG